VCYRWRGSALQQQQHQQMLTFSFAGDYWDGSSLLHCMLVLSRASICTTLTAALCSFKQRVPVAIHSVVVPATQAAGRYALRDAQPATYTECIVRHRQLL
jgi:hypothetical protein